MSLAGKTAAALVMVLALHVTPVAAYFVIELRDGRRLEANFVRRDGDVVHASHGSGEVTIPREQVTSIEEVEPGLLLHDPSAEAASAPDHLRPEGPRPSIDQIRERERRVTREIILSRRELLFARLRGDAPESIDARRGDVEALERRRSELRSSLPAWELAR